MYVFMYVYICMNICSCMYVCMYVSMCIPDGETFLLLVADDDGGEVGATRLTREWTLLTSEEGSFQLR